MKLRRSDFVTRYISLGGKPFSFKDREYLLPLYNTSRNIVLKGGRQIEKSTFLANLMISDLATHRFFNALYVSYTQKQVSFFSNMRFDPMIKFSPRLATKLNFKPGSVYRVTDKSFSNGSVAFFRPLFSVHAAETVRGLNVDRVCFDEVQSLDPKAIAVVEECLSHSKYKWIVYTGTAKSPQNPIEYYWNKSTQLEYLVKCEACGNWNFQDEKIIGVKSYICTKCGKPLNMRNGQLVAFGDKDAPLFGMRIPQTMVPWVTFEEIKTKYETLPLSLFYNEVLGLPYELGEKPVTLQELRRCCADREFLHPKPMQYCVAGVDWGGGIRSYTEVVIGRIEQNKYKVYYVHRFKTTDPIEQVASLAKILSYYNTKLVVCDFGFGDMKIQELAARLSAYGTLVLSCYYSNVKSRDILYKEKERMLHVNRTSSLSDIFRLIKQRRFEFPKYSIMESFFQEILNVNIEVHQIQGQERILYVHSAENPDDFLHALNYFKIAADVFYGMLSLQ